MICAKSEFFNATCKIEWASGKENLVTLAEEGPMIFAIFLSSVSTASDYGKRYIISSPQSTYHTNFSKSASTAASVSAQRLNGEVCSG